MAALLAGARRILVTRFRYLGDLVLTTPLLRVLRESAPGARITYLVEDHYADVLRGHPDIDHLLTVTRAARGAARVAENFRVAAALRRERFDIAIDLLANPRSALIVRMSGAPVRVGAAHRGRGRLFTHHPDFNAYARAARESAPHSAEGAEGVVNAVDYHLAHARVLGTDPIAAPVPRIPVAAAARAEAAKRLDALLPGSNEPVVGIHPGASWPGKRWTVEGFSALARWMIETWGARILVTCGPGEEALARRVVVAAGDHGALLMPLNWRDLAAMLSILDLYVANDCGPMHLAAATGTPTVGLFGPSDPAIWFPYPRELGHRVADAPLVCRPCPATRCGHRECLAVLTTNTVIAAAADAWRASGSGTQTGKERRELVRAT